MPDFMIYNFQTVLKREDVLAPKVHEKYNDKNTEPFFALSYALTSGCQKQLSWASDKWGNWTI